MYQFKVVFIKFINLFSVTFFPLPFSFLFLPSFLPSFLSFSPLSLQQFSLLEEFFQGQEVSTIWRSKDRRFYSILSCMWVEDSVYTRHDIQKQCKKDNQWPTYKTYTWVSGVKEGSDLNRQPLFLGFNTYLKMKKWTGLNCFHIIK